MWDSSTRAHIERQLKHLNRLSVEFRELTEDLPHEDPGLERRAALSTALQVFYQGIEGIFEMISKRVDGGVPSAPDWHRRLLDQMAVGGKGRPSVISTKLASRLDPYLGFRHLARHTYPFFLNWDRMRGLVQEMDPVLRSFEDQIQDSTDRMERDEQAS